MKPVRPTFERPPLIEQAITVMFNPLERFSIGDFGLFWSRIQEEFPECEAHQALDNTIESDKFEWAHPQFQLVEARALPRAFFHSKCRSELIQVQPDRFSFNWQGHEGQEYPRSEQTMARFQSLLEIFRSFVVDRGLGDIEIVQCELINVNIVPVSAFGNDFSDAAKVFNLGAPGPALDDLPLESYITNTRHRIVEDGVQIGRLYAVLSPVLKIADNEQAYRFELTVRGAPRNEDVASFFDAARNAINSAFLGWTTDWAHNLWGLKNG